MGLGILDKLKILGLMNKASNDVEKGIKMKNTTKIISAVVVLITSILQIPSVQSALVSFITTHPSVSLILTGLTTILALIHNPKDTVKVLILFALLTSVCLNAQQVQNFYAAGVSFNSGAAPQIAGTGLYAHVISNSDTYAFTAIDALPNTTNPFTVTTNFGVGIAQKIATISKFDIYIPTAAGISWSGSNTGWQWNTGALVPIKIKDNYFIAPTVRIVKSSVANGTGYQPVVGLLFGWGK